MRARSGPERAFLGLRPAAEAFLGAAAAAGTTRLATELVPHRGPRAAWGRDALVAALERAVAFRRFRAGDVKAILEAGPGVPDVGHEGQALVVDLPAVPVRPLADYGLEALA